ncbi:unnamed protein product, partial [Didymodactylos carnosus]
MNHDDSRKGQSFLTNDPCQPDENSFYKNGRDIVDDCAQDVAGLLYDCGPTKKDSKSESKRKRQRKEPAGVQTQMLDGTMKIPGLIELESTIKQRERSYKNWPMDGAPCVTEMIDSGFCYSGNGKEIVCFYCDLTHDHLTASDNPMTIHQTLSPNCPYVVSNYKKYIQLNSIPATADSDSGSLVSRGYYGIMQCSISPYKCLSARTASFLKWPAGAFPNASEAAKAGFYYSEEDSKIKCFCCGSSPPEWNPTHDPTANHLRWFPACTYAQQLNDSDPVRPARSLIEPDRSVTAPSLPNDDYNFVKISVPNVYDDNNGTNYFYVLRSQNQNNESILLAACSIINAPEHLKNEQYRQAFTKRYYENNVKEESKKEPSALFFALAVRMQTTTSVLPLQGRIVQPETKKFKNQDGEIAAASMRKPFICGSCRTEPCEMLCFPCRHVSLCRPCSQRL